MKLLSSLIFSSISLFSYAIIIFIQISECLTLPKIRSARNVPNDDYKSTTGSMALLARHSSGNNLTERRCPINKEEQHSLPLLCYQCKSTTGEKENEYCDHDLWRLTRHSEKHQFSLRCPVGVNTYCVKQVQTKRGQQITERGCFGPGPVNANDNTKVFLKSGCATYSQNGFLTTTCLCTSSCCNTASIKALGFPAKNAILLLSMILVQLIKMVLFLH